MSFDLAPLRPQFEQAEPFPHIVVADLWPQDELRAAAAEFPPGDDRRWITYPDPKEYGKRAGDARMWGPATRRFFDVARSAATCRRLEDLTGIGPLTADDIGGGMHTTGPGGRLETHVDFNVHPSLPLERRLNMLVFLNDEWDLAWGGVLYLGQEREVEVAAAVQPHGHLRLLRLLVARASGPDRRRALAPVAGLLLLRATAGGDQCSAHDGAEVLVRLPHRAAVIPTRNRHDLLADCINSVIDQVDRVIVIDNLSDPPIDPEPWHGKVGVISLPVDPPNISVLWNVGLDLVAGSTPTDVWDVAVLNSDVVIPAGWVEALSTAMRSTTAVLAYPDQFGGTRQILHTEARPVDLHTRITGYAYLLRGEAGLRLDESMAWWYSDDDLDWRAREQGGALLVPGHPVEHRTPNGSMYERPELHDQAVSDRTTFITKWGKAPH
jgi:hypothetical protein